MKKFAYGLFAALAVSSSAFAAPTAIDPETPVTTAECAILGESVNLTLSSNVQGAYNCDEALNAANVGACHTSGSRSTSLTCAQIGTDNSASPPAPIWNNDQCTTNGEVIDLGSASYRGYRASTTGGSVGPQSLSGNCAAGIPEAELVNFP